jgi:uncharacterized protein (TIGR02147 family)
MNAQVALQQVLRTRYQEIRSRNPSYSVRAFSKKLGLSAGTVSLLLLGKRKASHKLAARIGERLNLDPQERSLFLPSFELSAKRVGDPTHTDTRYLQLTADQFHVVSDWTCFALLNLIKTKGFQSDPAWIARRLGIPKAKVNRVIERLQRLGMLVISPEGKYSRGANRYRTTDDVANSAVRASHYQTLELARDSLDRDPVDARDFTWLTVSLDPKALPEAKSLIRRFQDDFLQLIERNPAAASEVYRMSMQLFPLTRLEPTVPKKRK